MEMPFYRSGSLISTAIFQEPAFELKENSCSLQKALFKTLRELDLRLENIQEAAAFPSPGNWQISMSFLSFRASLRVRVDGFEVTFLNPAMNDAPVLKDALKRIESAFSCALPEINVVRRDLVLHAHFEIPDGYRTVTQPYWGPYPEGLGDLSGQGVGWYFRSPLFSGEAGVVLEKSILIEDGLYVQTRCRFDTSTFDLEASFDSFQSYLQKVVEALRLGGTK